MKFLENNSKKQLFYGGFSLVEILIYISVFAIISIVVINSYIVIMNSFAYTRTNRELLESANGSLERISREIRQASSIDIANSTLGSTVGILQLNSTNDDGSSKIVKFSILDGALNLYQDGILIGNLLGQNISVTTLLFRRIETISNQEAIKIEIVLQDDRSKTLHSENFYDTLILRGGY